jgi:putative flippase GtrA
MEMTKKDNWVQFIKFTAFSISAGVIQAGSFTLLNELTKFPYWPSYLISITLSVLWNFTLNRRFTFKSSNNIPVAMTKILIFYIFFIPITTWSGDAIVNAGVNEYIVLGVTMILNFVTEFLFSRIFIYKNQMNTREERLKKA